MTPRRGTRLAVEPFRSWLAAECQRNGTGLMAARCGVTERQLWRVLHENYQWVSLDLVDRCLLDSPVCLEELYPWAA